MIVKLLKITLFRRFELTVSCTIGEGVVDVAEAVSSCVTDIVGGISGAEDGSSAAAAATIEAATVNGISVSCP